jgi:hypothetical protein
MRLLTTFLLTACCSLIALAQPLRLLPQNPHYFEYKGKPTVIVGSGEHYGAVMNTAFDYKTYLQTLNRDGMNTTRLFTGAYFEVPGAFGIQKNTMAPKPEDLLLPWSRGVQTETAGQGYALGGNRFDLTRWNPAYFARLKDFLSHAERNGVIVEVTLFSSYYGEGWAYHPFNRPNNVNTTTPVKALDANTLNNGNVLIHQEAYVREIVRAVNGFDNVYFEIQNEPWADLKDTILVRNEYHEPAPGKSADWRSTLEVTAQRANDWQRRVAEWIVSEEQKLPKKHLISQNIGNFHYPVANPDPNVSIFNFHYALPEAVTENYYLNKVIGFNETGFAGRRDATYRRQAWRFMMAGGGLFNQLDYSFSLGFENGQDTSYAAPGGGSPALRQQFRILKTYLEKLDLPKLKPATGLVVAAPAATTHALTNGTSQWIVYGEPLGLNWSAWQLNLTRGNYRAEWTDVVTGQVLKNETYTHTGGPLRLKPVGRNDVVLLLRKP